MRLNTEQYEASHGKAPRGRGSWWFDVRLTIPGLTEPFAVTENAYGTLTDAVAIAKRRSSKDFGGRVSEIVVLP